MFKMRYKKNTTGGVEYMQIWDGDSYKMSLGTADKLHAELVRLKKMEAQTKELRELQTKINKINKDHSDQRGIVIRKGGVSEEKVE